MIKEPIRVGSKYVESKKKNGKNCGNVCRVKIWVSM